VRYVLIAVAVVALVLVVTQFALPSYLAGRVEDHLTARGGTATVDLDAVPALRLLAHEGDKFKLRGHGLDFPLDQGDAGVFDKLDGFDSVDVRLSDVKAGPFTVGRFALSRGTGDHDYRMISSGRSSVAEVSSYLTSGLPPLVSSILNGTARSVAGAAGDRPIPYSVVAALASDHGQPRLVTVNGRVAGIPAGPFAALLAQSVLSRL
jgi:hypothetical protein